MKSPLRVALIQSSLHWENISANLKMFDQKIDAVLSGQTVDLIVLPETFTTGFSMNPKLAEPMNGSAVQWMKKISREKRVAITGSLMIQEDGRFYNRLVWIDEQNGILTYDKRHLFCISDEPKFFTAGTEKLVVDFQGWKICPLICYDLRFPVWARNSWNAESENPQYDLLLYVANWPERRRHAWKQLLIARAIENQCYVVGVNRVGLDGTGANHAGDSTAIDALGKIIYEKEHEKDSIIVDLDVNALTEVRSQLPFLKDADDFILNPKTKIKSH